MYEELVCPRCHGLLAATNNDSLSCRKCGHSYHINNGVPIMWVPEFEENATALERLQKETGIVSKTLIGKPQREPGAWEIAYFLPDRGNNYAAKKMDERIYAPLSRMLWEYLKDARILNVGCGWGNETGWLLKHGAQDIVCTDISLSLIEVAKSRFSEGLGPRYYFQANAEFLPVADNSFDMIFARSTMHHFPRPLNFLREAARVAPTIVLCFEPSDMRIFKHLLKWVKWETEYGSLKSHRFDVDKLRRFMADLGYEADIGTDFVWFPLKLIKRCGNKKLLVDTYYSFLSAINLVLGRWGHNFTMVARRTKR